MPYSLYANCNNVSSIPDKSTDGGTPGWVETPEIKHPSDRAWRSLGRVSDAHRAFVAVDQPGVGGDRVRDAHAWGRGRTEAVHNYEGEWPMICCNLQSDELLSKHCLMRFQCLQSEDIADAVQYAVAAPSHVQVR